jgi:hypothetical protein
MLYCHLLTNRCANTYLGNSPLRCDVNRQIGHRFEGLAYSGVSEANQRFSLRMPEDRDVLETVEKIARSMSNVNGLLPEAGF